MKPGHWILITGMLALLLLSSCQPTPPVTPASSPSPASVEATPLVESAPAYPPPESATYPPPVEGQIVGIYPGPTTGDASGVDWPTAENTILAGEAAEIYLDNLFHVTLVLKNGQVLVTVQPALDEVSKILDRCGEPCKDTLVVSK